MQIRPMRADEVDAVVDVAYAALWSYAGEADRPRRRARVAYLLKTDPGGAFVAEDDGILVGMAMALRREGLWGLSALAVTEEARGRGAGRALLGAALGHAEGSRVRVVLSSEDPAAMRLYAQAGHELHPCVSLSGIPTARPAAPTGVRDGSIADAGWMDDVARAVRGAGYGPDVGHWIDVGFRLRCIERRAWGVIAGGKLACLHALDEEAAVALLEDHLATSAESVQVDFVTAGQDWAIRAGLAAGLALSPDGPMFTSGELGTRAPWVPSGAYL